jgi:hypothetical protein
VEENTYIRWCSVNTAGKASSTVACDEVISGAEEEEEEEEEEANKLMRPLSRSLWAKFLYGQMVVPYLIFRQQQQQQQQQTPLPGLTWWQFTASGGPPHSRLYFFRGHPAEAVMMAQRPEVTDGNLGKKVPILVLNYLQDRV